MKRIYNQPEITVAQFASMTLMQAASPATTPTMDLIDSNGEQWKSQSKLRLLSNPFQQAHAIRMGLLFYAPCHAFLACLRPRLH